MRQQDGLDRIAEGQIGIADDTGGDAGRTVIPRALIAAMPATNSVSPTGLGFGGAARAVHRGGIPKNTVSDDVLAGVEVGEAAGRGNSGDRRGCHR